MKKILFAVLISLMFMACPPKQPQVVKKATSAQMVETKLNIKGMHCEDCEISIQKGVNALPGIDSVSASYEDSTAFVRFDSTKTNLKQIAEAITKRGYAVKD